MKPRLKGYLAIPVTLLLMAVNNMEVQASREEGEAFEEKHIPGYIRQLQGFKGLRESENKDYVTIDKIEVSEYQVQQGDNLIGIARRKGTDAVTLAELNSITNPHWLLAGDTIEVVSTSGIIHEVEQEEEWTEIASEYEVPPEKIRRLDDKEKTEPVEGERLFIVVEGREQLSRSLDRVSQPSFQWPLQGTITSTFGWRSSGFHHGLDIAAPHGTPVKASAGGAVTYAYNRQSYGLLVEIDHGGGWKTRYGHNSEVLVRSGEAVKAGQTVSRVGATGNATGPHVHFEIWKDGERIDPQRHLP